MDPATGIDVEGPAHQSMPVAGSMIAGLLLRGAETATAEQG